LNDSVEYTIEDNHGSRSNQATVNLVRSQLSGSVYLDRNDNGVRDAGEGGVGGVAIVLTGTDDLGKAVHIVTHTGAGGYYSFANLRGGNYNIKEVQPTRLRDGKDTPGTINGLGAPASGFNDVFIALFASQDEFGNALSNNGVNFNFGEHLSKWSFIG